ncbi:MAG: hypothetical protein JNK82_27905 [Myxococcaceae bacterium]|nr:hypothetical protein [Myxococcaceae bacterium]
MTPLKPLAAKPVTVARPAAAPLATKVDAPKPPDVFAPRAAPKTSATLAAELADQTEHLRLFREVFPAREKPKAGVEVMFVSFKGDDRFVTKKLNAAAGNALVKSDWAPRLEALLKALDGQELHGYRVKLLEHFYGMASLALVPSGDAARDADAAARELSQQLAAKAGDALGGFLSSARADHAARGTPDAHHQVELLDGMLRELGAKAPQLVSHGLSEVHIGPRKGPPVFALLSAVYRARAAAALEQLTRDAGSERFDAAALVNALKSPDGFAGALSRLKSATVSFGALTLPVVVSDAASGSQGLNPEVLRLLRGKVQLDAAPGVLEDVDTVVQQAMLLDFVAFGSNRTLARDGTQALQHAADVQLELQQNPASTAAQATAKALLAPQKAGVLVAQSGTPSELYFFAELVKQPHTVYLSVDIKALGATAQGAMVRHAAALSKLNGAVHADDVFYRALAANDEVVARKAAVLGPIEQKLREAAQAGGRLSVLAFGDEAVFALSGFSDDALKRALAAVGSAEGARLVVTETRAVPGESFNEALDRNTAAMGSADRGNETLKELERKRELLRYQLLALPEGRRDVALAKLDASVVSNVVARVSDGGVTLLDARTGAAVELAELESALLMRAT